MERTLIIIKPDGVARCLTGKIVQRIEDKGLTITKMVKTTLETPKVEAHYAHLKDRPFFSDLVTYMTTGPVILLEVTGENVIQVMRNLAGPTDSCKAPAGTIRGDFGTSVTQNVIHASDSVEAAESELQRFF